MINRRRLLQRRSIVLVRARATSISRAPAGTGGVAPEARQGPLGPARRSSGRSALNILANPITWPVNARAGPGGRGPVTGGGRRAPPGATRLRPAALSFEYRWAGRAHWAQSFRRAGCVIGADVPVRQKFK